MLGHAAVDQCVGVLDASRALAPTLDETALIIRCTGRSASNQVYAIVVLCTRCALGHACRRNAVVACLVAERQVAACDAGDAFGGAAFSQAPVRADERQPILNSVSVLRDAILHAFGISGRACQGAGDELSAGIVGRTGIALVVAGGVHADVASGLAR